MHIACNATKALRQPARPLQRWNIGPCLWVNYKAEQLRWLSGNTSVASARTGEKDRVSKPPPSSRRRRGLVKKGEPQSVVRDVRRLFIRKHDSHGIHLEDEKAKLAEATRPHAKAPGAMMQKGAASQGTKIEDTKAVSKWRRYTSLGDHGKSPTSNVISYRRSASPRQLYESDGHLTTRFRTPRWRLRRDKAAATRKVDAHILGRGGSGSPTSTSENASSISGRELPLRYYSVRGSSRSVDSEKQQERLRRPLISSPPSDSAAPKIPQSHDRGRERPLINTFYAYPPAWQVQDDNGTVRKHLAQFKEKESAARKNQVLEGTATQSQAQGKGAVSKSARRSRRRTASKRTVVTAHPRDQDKIVAPNSRSTSRRMSASKRKNVTTHPQDEDRDVASNITKMSRTLTASKQATGTAHSQPLSRDVTSTSRRRQRRETAPKRRNVKANPLFKRGYSFRTKRLESYITPRPYVSHTPIRDDIIRILRMLSEATPSLNDSSKNVLTDPNSEYWEEHESDGRATFHNLGDVIDDITYAPRSEALRVRAQWTGEKQSNAGIALLRRPRTWSPVSFERYIRQLIAISRQSSKDYQGALGTAAATKELVSLLRDVKFVPYIHNYSLNLALVALRFHDCYDDVVQLHHHLRRQSFEFDALNFSNFLSAAAFHDTGLHFRPILKHMLESGFKPTGHTWYVFYGLVSQKFPSKQWLVLRRMRSKGITKAGEPHLKKQLIRSLGWIEDSELNIDRPKVKDVIREGADQPTDSNYNPF